jgi:hypothetical protein
MSGLHHIAHRAPDGVWHAAYVIPGTFALHSVLDAGSSERAAIAEADRLNREQEAKNKPYIEPANRPLAPGFYTNKEDQ